MILKHAPGRRCLILQGRRPGLEIYTMEAGDNRNGFSPEIFEKVYRLEYQAHMVVEGLLSGQHKSPARGFNVEFLEHRPYYTGDDLRYVDWKVYAKNECFYVKQHEEETNLRAYMVLDTSSSMDFGGKTGGRKLAQARLLSAALSYLFLKQGDSVGLLPAGGGAGGGEFIQPRSARGHLHRLIAGMLETQVQGEANLHRALRVLSDRMGRGGVLMVFSDLLEEPGPVQDSLKIIRGRGNEVVLFHVLDETELDFPFTRASRFIDPESGDEVAADPTAARSLYMKNLEEFIGGYRDFCRRVDADYTIAPTSKSAGEVLIEFLQKRERRARR